MLLVQFHALFSGEIEEMWAIHQVLTFMCNGGRKINYIAVVRAVRSSHIIHFGHVEVNAGTVV